MARQGKLPRVKLNGTLHPLPSGAVFANLRSSFNQRRVSMPPMRSQAGVALLLAFAATPVQAQKPSPAGTWLSQSGETRVRLAPCGAQMCGTIVWMRNPGKDVNNPDPAQRGRDLVGIRMITMSPAGDTEW
jgi:uncharacterized protein (DUF2147 family)